jgi:hypothetical protein
MPYDDLPDDEKHAADQRLIARTTAYRNSPEYQADTLMERTRAAVCFINARDGKGSRLEMFGFLSLFHPDMTDQRKREIIGVMGLNR